MPKARKKFAKFEIPPSVTRGLFMYEQGDTMNSGVYGDLPSPVAFRMLSEALVGFLADAVSSAVVQKINQQTEALFEEIEGQN